MKPGESSFVVVPIPGGGPLLVLKPAEFLRALRRGKKLLERDARRGDSTSEGGNKQ